MALFIESEILRMVRRIPLNSRHKSAQTDVRNFFVGQLYAVKTVLKNRFEDLDIFVNEITMLRNLVSCFSFMPNQNQDFLRSKLFQTNLIRNAAVYFKLGPPEYCKHLRSVGV